MIRRGNRLAAFATVGVLMLAACGSDDDNGSSATTVAAPGTTTASSSETTTAGTEAPGTTTESTAAETTEAPAEAWTAPTDDCSDPDAAAAPIEGELKLGSYQPISGSPAAAAFSPVKDGLELYVQYANDNDLLNGVKLSIDIKDDQYDPTQTPGVVDGMIDEGINVVTGGIGTPNGLAVRDTLNEECIPQLLNLSGDPAWGDVENYPWTTGALVPYDIESKIYADKIAELKPGATVGMFTVNSDFGKVYVDAFKAAADEKGLEIVDEQTIEPAETAPPTNQVGSIAGNTPDVILAVPLGAQCPTFLKELANAKAANPGWEPLVFLTNTCSSRLLISALAAGAGDGVYTSGNGIDPSDPKNAGVEAMKPFMTAYTAKGLAGDLGTTAVGWSIGEDTLKILQKAQESGTLSRASIIEAARNLEFTPSLGRDGVVYRMAGADDPYTFQSLQVLQWDETNGTYTEIGDTITSFES